MHKNINLKKALIFLFSINMIQIIAIISIIVYFYIGKIIYFDSQEALGLFFLLVIIVLTIIMSSLLISKFVSYFLKSSSYYNSLSQTNSQLKDLNNTLRSQRHDFMNHLQVVYSLIEMDEYKDAKDYIERIYNDIQKVNRILKTSNPAVNALLQAKLINAEKMGIDIQIDIRTHLSELVIPSWEFCRILGNLIDNAIFALQYISDVKRLYIELSEDIKSYFFRISNNGPAIDNHILERIFEPGFSTKKEKGEGMGLSITKEILEKYKGSISVDSNEDLTVFEGCIPKA